MKSRFLFIAILLNIVSQTAFAEIVNLKCYYGLNPSAVTIVNQETNIKEKATSANIMIYDEVNLNDQGLAGKTSLLKINAQSNSMKFSTVAILTSPKNYSVECDGGSAKIHQLGKILIFKSDRFDGEVATTDEGCASGSIQARYLALEEMNCTTNH